MHKICGGNNECTTIRQNKKINKLLHNNNSSKVVFNDICAVLTDILDSNVLVVSRKGKILGVSKCPDVREIHELITEGGRLSYRCDAQRAAFKRSFYQRKCQS